MRQRSRLYFDCRYKGVKNMLYDKEEMLRICEKYGIETVEKEVYKAIKNQPLKIKNKIIIIIKK